MRNSVSKTVKIQILRIRFLRHSESNFYIYNEKTRGLKLDFLSGKYRVIIRIYSSPNFRLIYLLKKRIGLYRILFWQFTLKFINFLIKFYVFWKSTEIFLNISFSPFGSLEKIVLARVFKGQSAFFSYRF
jgi:hypothetical protein